MSWSTRSNWADRRVAPAVSRHAPPFVQAAGRADRAGRSAAGRLPQGALSPPRARRLDRRGHAQQLRRRRRRRPAGDRALPPAPAPARRSPPRPPNGSTAPCPGRAGRGQHATSSWPPAPRWNGCRRRRSCSTAARCAAGCGSISPPMPGSSAWRAWCSAATAMGETVQHGRDRRPDRGAPRRQAAAARPHPARRPGGRAAGAPGGRRRARAVATIVHAAPDAEARLDAVRGALAGTTPAPLPGTACCLRASSPQDGACLRAAVVAGLNVLRDGRPLPRVWLC